MSGRPVRVAGLAALGAALTQVAVLGLLAGTNGRSQGGTPSILRTASYVLVGVALVGVFLALFASRGRGDQLGGAVLVGAAGVAVVLALRALVPSLVGDRGPYWLHADVGHLAVGLALLPVAAWLLSRGAP